MRLGLFLLAMFALVGTNRVGAAFEIPCAQQCGMEAEQAYHQCREQGGDEDECKAGAAQTFASCITTNCDGEPQDCQATCADVAMSIQNECLGACTEGDACAAL